MKKKLTLILTFLLLTALLPHRAQAVMSRVEVFAKTVLIEEKEDSVNVFVFARLENTGRTDMTFDSGRFDVYDKKGELLGSDEYPAVFAAKYLRPGEHGFLRAYVELEGVTPEQIGETELSVDCQNYKGKSRIDRFDCTPAYEKDVVYGGWLTYDYMGVTVTNRTDSVLYDLEAVIVLYDKEDHILNIGYAFMGMLNDVGLHPGGTVTLRDINSESMQAAYTKAGYTAAYMEGIAYTEVYG